ncbi:hypothetical protein D3C80_1658590 [compost metagenome]
MAELRPVSGLFDGVNQRLGARAAGHFCVLNGHFSMVNVRALLQALFNAFNAVAAGEAIQRQVDCVRHNKNSCIVIRSTIDQ